jgi:uncharacterized protein (TIGR04255 family)
MSKEIKKRKHRHLKNAPIVEALFDIQVQTSPDLSITSLKESFTKLVEPEYPSSEEIRAMEGFINFSAQGPQSRVTDLGSIGYMYRNESRTRAIQFRRNGFTFSQLKPYESWESLLEHSQRWWGSYSQIIPEKTVTRIALRFINRLELPGDCKDIHTYLPYAPKVPLKGDYPIAEFVDRIVFQNQATGAKCIFTQVLEPSSKDGFLNIVVDIDAFYEVGDRSDSIDLWAKFLELREFKNDVFYRGVSKRAWERYL